MPASAATHQVAVVDDEFIPSALTIAPGDTVTWTGGGSYHTVTADDASFNAIVENGQVFSWTFTAEGRYPYFCSMHGGPNGTGMSGSVRVTDISQNVAPAQPLNATPVNGAVNVSTSPTLSASSFSDANAADIHAASQWVMRVLGEVDPAFDSGETSADRSSIVLSGLENGTTYEWQVRYMDDVGAWSDYSAPTTFTTIAGPVGNGTGLLATYGAYNLRRNTFVAKTTQVDAAVDFDWGVRRANRFTPANHFFVRWEGTVLPQFSELYLFRIRADGGVRLWVNGQLIIDDWVTWKFPIFRNGAVDLADGVPVPIMLEYFDTTGAASCSLRWCSPSRPIEVIPQAKLFPPAP
jgi:plastocyanin